MLPPLRNTLSHQPPLACKLFLDMAPCFRQWHMHHVYHADGVQNPDAVLHLHTSNQNRTQGFYRKKTLLESRSSQECTRTGWGTPTSKTPPPTQQLPSHAKTFSGSCSPSATSTPHPSNLLCQLKDTDVWGAKQHPIISVLSSRYSKIPLPMHADVRYTVHSPHRMP